MMLSSMLCWGSWANTQKIDKTWRFELFYWDYMWGILVCATVLRAGYLIRQVPGDVNHRDPPVALEQE